eukprot:comp21677_c0_seq1/m.30526 comp21677_c0_seq1/g.30526  ORF comp21677_c0_seq1/g.30526 comp21677_c0_seq1/m.30526 type:complete len:741 (-) comp21677_c0_seq1:329-2551(-)
MSKATLTRQRVDFEKTWASVRHNVEAVITCQGVDKVSWMDVYTDIYKLCTANPSPYYEALYSRLKEFLQKHTERIREEVLAGDNLLAAYNDKWRVFQVGAECLQAIFQYLNKNWVEKRRKDADSARTTLYTPSLTPAASEPPMEVAQLALHIWKVTLLDPPIKKKLVHDILREIHNDRNGEMVTDSVVQGVIQSFVHMNKFNTKKPEELYQETFERPFLEATAEYYKRESALFLADNDCAAYMRKAEQRLKEEELRSQKFIDPSSYKKLQQECEAQLIEAHKAIMEAECETYIRSNRLEELSRMYKLLKRIVGGLDPMLAVFQKYVTDAGRHEMAAIPTLEPQTYVEALLAIHTKYSSLVKNAFDSDANFVASLDKACRCIVNFNGGAKGGPARSPELLAKYIDQLLKKSSRSGPEGDVDEQLGHIMTVFKYVDDKDVFQKFYSRMLAKRLIHALSVSDEAEEAMISHLKQACGFEYTSKLQRMFTDMRVSADINTEFKEQRGTQLGTDFHILVLQAGAWPLSQAGATSFSIPQELERCVQSFELFYGDKYTGRKLNWLHHLSKADIKVNYLKKRYELQATNYQMALLLMYNNADSYTRSEMEAQTQLSGSELDRTIESLLSVKLLTSQGDRYHLNMKFSNKRTKLKITSAVPQETQKESEQTHNQVSDDRNMYLQAAVVRTMKARKTLTHTELVQEVLTQAKARFIPSVPLIKKCIEQLIDKQYLERIEGSRDKYSYVA